MRTAGEQQARSGGAAARRRSARGALDVAVLGLGADELRVLVRIAERLRVGQRTYGSLSLATDGRDFRTEAREEVEDFLVYAACRWLKEAP